MYSFYCLKHIPNYSKAQFLTTVKTCKTSINHDPLKNPGFFLQFGAVSEAKKQKRVQIIKECAEETGVPKGIVLRARQGNFEQDPLLEQYFYCINKRSGVLNEEGHFNTDVLRKGLTEVFNAEEAERLIETCARNLDNKLQASYDGIKCFYREAPEVAVVF